MAHISRLGMLRHLRAEPNQFILHYRKGKLSRRGAGLAYWFNPLSAAVAQLPVEDCETTFVLRERTSDFQEVSVQCTVTYRVTEPERAAARVNFSISLDTGSWVDIPLDRMAGLWSQQSLQPTRTYLKDVPVSEAVRAGGDVIRTAVDEALRADAEIADMGLALVAVQVDRIAPTAELEKALQTPTREKIQQKADEAVFERRALAVEKERAIKENELATEIELSRRHEELLKQQGANQMIEIRSQAETEKARIEGEMERERIRATEGAEQAKLRAEGTAEARRIISAADRDTERERVALLGEAPSQVLAGLVLERFADKLQQIQHLNLSPDLLGSALQQFLRDQADK